MTASSNEITNQLRNVWQEERTAIGAWVLSPDPILAEATALAGSSAVFCLSAFSKFIQRSMCDSFGQTAAGIETSQSAL